MPTAIGQVCVVISKGAVNNEQEFNNQFFTYNYNVPKSSPTLK